MGWGLRGLRCGAGAGDVYRTAALEPGAACEAHSRGHAEGRDASRARAGDIFGAGRDQRGARCESSAAVGKVGGLRPEKVPTKSLTSRKGREMGTRQLRATWIMGRDGGTT